MNTLLKLLGSTAFAQIIAISISPILTRIYSPEAFGDFLIITSWLYIINAIALGKMDLAIIKETDKKKIPEIFSLGIFLLLCTTVATTIITIFASSLSQTGAAAYLMLPAMIASLAFYQLILALHLREHETNFVAKNKITQSLMLSSSQIGLGLLSPTAIALATAQAGSFFVTCLLRIRKWKKYLIRSNPLIALKKYSRYAVYENSSNFLQVASSNTPPILLGYILGGFFGGIYYMTYRILITPISIFSVSINQTISSNFQKFKDNEATWKQENATGMRHLMIFFCIPFAVLGAHIEPFFPKLFGSEWVQAGTLIKAFCPWIFLRLIYDSFSIHLSLADHSKFKATIDFAIFSLTLAVIYVLWSQNFEGSIFLLYFAATNSIIYTLALVTLIIKCQLDPKANICICLVSTALIATYWTFGNIYTSTLLIATLSIATSLTLKARRRSINK